MKSGRFRIWVAAAVLVFAAVQAADAADSRDVPSIDLQTRCRKSEKVMVEMMGDSSLQGKGFELCMRAEQDARNAITAAWPDVPASYKSFCIRPAAYSPSYVEWIACLELLIDLRKLRAARP